MNAPTRVSSDDSLPAVIIRAVFIGMVVAFAGTIPRNLIFAANLRYFAGVLWAGPLAAVYLWWHGQAEWQAAPGPSALLWQTGADASFWFTGGALVVIAAATAWAFLKLARAARPRQPAST